MNKLLVILSFAASLLLTTPALATPGNVLADGPAAFYRMNDTITKASFAGSNPWAGGTMLDSSAHAFHGAYPVSWYDSKNKTTHPNPLGKAASVSATLGTAVSFSHSEQPNLAQRIVSDEMYGHVKSNPWLNLSNNFSLEAWVYPTKSVSSSVYPIVRKGTTSGYSGGGNYYLFLQRPTGSSTYQLKLFFDTKLISSTGSVSYSIASATTSSVIASDKWSHVSATVSSNATNSTIRLYVNGSLLTTRSYNFRPVATNSGDLYIGRSSSYDYTSGFSGKIDEVAIFNYALTSAQVLSHKNL